MSEASRTVVTELATALGMLAPSIEAGIAMRPAALHHVDDHTWLTLHEAFTAGRFGQEFSSAFANGRAFFEALDGLRRRPPRRVEWKGPHRPPGDDVTRADLRVDHVYQVSCKYRSRVMQNAGPPRLFDHLLASERRTSVDWFLEVAPAEYRAFYDAVVDWTGLRLPRDLVDLNATDRAALRDRLRPRQLPDDVREPWMALVARVASATAERWSRNLGGPHDALRMLWRLTRIGDAPYFLLGANGHHPLRLRVASRWDWVQQYELRSFHVIERAAGQPEVGWTASVRHRANGSDLDVTGHVEVRWSHGRFGGMPEAKIYLDTPIEATPGYYDLA